MDNGTGLDDQLVSRSELAALAGVRRPTITTWAKRHRDFPEIVRTSGGDYFRLVDALAWLDRRPIPVRELAADETAGLTYGRRARHQSLRDDIAPLARAEVSQGTDTEQMLERLFGRLAMEVRGGAGSSADYLYLLLCLVFLRGRATSRWSELRRIGQPAAERIRPDVLLRRIGAFTNEVLRLHGIPPGAQPAFDRLRPRSTSALPVVIRRCDGLGTNAFDRLLDRFAAEIRPTSVDFFTPDEVAFLMASMVAGEEAIDGPVYDPYFRGGELLRATALARPAAPPPVRGESPNPQTLRLAGMRLALHGSPAELRPGSSAPWDHLDGSRDAAAVLLNPPFNAKALTRACADESWTFGPPPSYNDNYAWLQYAIASLAPEGRAAVLMPTQAAISPDEQEHGIRREMVKRGAVEAVIALPPRLFPSTDVAVTLWIVQPPTGSPDPILFVDAGQMGNRTRTGQVLPRAAATVISELYANRRHLPTGQSQELAESGRGVMATIEALRRTNYSLNPTDYMDGSLGSASRPRPERTDGCEEPAVLRARVNRADSRVESLRSSVPLGGSSGVLSAHWSRLPLKDLCEIQPGPSYGRLGIDKRIKDGPVPIVMPRNMRYRRVLAAEMETTTREMAEKLAKFCLRTGDVLCVRSGAQSEPALVGEGEDGWLFGTNLFRLRIPDPARTDPAYLQGFLCLPAVLDWIRSRSAGSAVPFISTRSLGQLMVNLPPIDEQRHIGSALIAYDEQIAAHQDFVRAAMSERTTLAEQLMEGALTLR